jgi:hypothetical protein
MQKPSAARIEIQLGMHPESSTSPVPSNPTLRQVLSVSSVMALGVFANFSALSAYTPINTRRPMAVMFCLVLLPAALTAFSLVRKRTNNPKNHLKTWLGFVVSSSVALWVLAILLFLNGSLDRSPGNETKATVVRKAAVRGRRGGTQHHLTVTSWQAGRSVEYFKVTSNVFDRAVVGKAVTVEVHQGFFGMPWHGEISSE